MKCEFTVLLCLVILGNGKYLSDDEIKDTSQSDFDLKGVLKGNSNIKREVEGNIPEDRLTDNNKTGGNEQSTRKHKIEIPEGRIKYKDPLALSEQPENKIFAEYIDAKRAFAMLPDYMIYNIYLSAKSTTG